MKNIIENKFGRSFPSGLVFVGYVVMAIGVLAILDKPLLGIGIVVVCSFICFTRSGIQIDIENKKYKDYTSFFGFIKQGKWESLADFPYLGILRKNMSSTIQSAGNVASTTSTDTVYDICLLNQTHRKKLIVQRIKDREKAQPAAASLAQILGVELTEYSPVISEATRARRR